MNTVSADVRCLLCGEAKPELLQKGVRLNPDLNVLRCHSCGLARLDPMADEEQLAAFYRDGYRQEYDPGVAPAKAHEQDLAEARQRVQRLGRLLSSDVSLLEIGSGSGAFLASARGLVRECAGVEPTESHRTWAAQKLGLTVASDLDALKGRFFDRIVLFHVLEHLRLPVDFLKLLLSRLSPQGRLVVEVPNLDDALLSLYRLEPYSKFYFQSAHLWYFSASTLDRAIGEAGGKAEITGVQRYDLSNHLRWLNTGKPGGMGYYPELAGADEAYRRALIEAGRADTLWAVVAKETSGKK